MEKRCFGNVLALVFTLAILFIIAGCEMQDNDIQPAGAGTQQISSSPFVPMDELNQGLNILKKTQEDELVVGYREGDRAIYFQTLRGEDLVLGENTVDPDAPPYEVSARIVDMGGNPVAISFGGDDERVADWQNRVSGLDDDHASTEQEDDLKLAAKAAGELSEAVSGFDEETKVLERRSQTALADVIEAASMPKAKGTVYTTTYYVRRKLASGFAGDHSAVYAIIVKPNNTFVTVVTCNHGTCADSGTMSTKCSNVVTASYYNAIPMLPCDAAGSPYTSLFYTYGHDCNDDTFVQVAKILTGATVTTTCFNTSLRVFAPNCYATE